MVLITTLGPLGLISGPGLGGVLVDVLGWPWMFFVNVPASVLVAAVALRTLPRGGPLRLPDRTWLSESLLGAALAALLLSLSFAASWGPVWVLLALVGVPLLLLWLRMPGSGAFRELLRAPGEAGPRLALASSAAAVGTVFFIAPYFMQRQLGESVSAAGVTVLAFPAGMALTGPVGGILGDWWGAQRTAALGAALFTAGLCLLIPMSGSWGLSDLAGRLFRAGCGSGRFNTPHGAGDGPQAAAAAGDRGCLHQPRPPDRVGPGARSGHAGLVCLLLGCTGIGGAMALAAVLSALSIAALVRTAVPAHQAAPGQDQRAADGSLT